MPSPVVTWRVSSSNSSSESQTLGDLVRDGRLAIVGAMYDVATGDIEFLPHPADGPCERRASSMHAHEDLA